MFCKHCGTQLNPGAQFCKHCGTPVTATAGAPAPPRPEPNAPQVIRVPVASSPRFSEPKPPLSTAAKIRRTAMAGVVLVALIGGGWYWYRGYSLERKLETAIAKGHLLSPPGESAYDYYQQLKRSSASEQVRTRFEEQLLPLLTPRPIQMLANLETPGTKDPTATEWEEANRLLVWVSELTPGDKGWEAKALYCAGRVAYLSGRKDEALKSWRRASELDSSWALPSNGVGLIYNERKEYQAARTYFQEAIRRAPNLAMPYNNMGTSYFYEKNDDQAEYYYRLAVERASQWPRPHVWLAEIAMHRKQYEWAAQEYQAALNLDPGGATGIDAAKVRESLERARLLAAQSLLTPPAGLIR